jgi:hypothetical protein
LKAWYDASDATTLWKDTGFTIPVTADADVVLGMSDKSGLGFHMTVAANGPDYKVNIQNAKSVIRFNGSDDVLSNTVGVWSDLTQPCTIACVAKAATTAATGLIWDAAAAPRAAFFLNSTGPVWTAFAGSSVAFTGAPAADTSWHVFIVEYSGAASTLTLDGTSYTAAATTGTGSAGAPRVGADEGAPANFWAGDMGEIMWVSGAMSAANKTAFRTYALTKWNV